MGQIVYLTKQGGDAVFNTVFVGRLIAQSGTTLRGNLVVSGSITAQTLIVNTTSVYSGSTRFGSIIGDTHQFTGSILTSGSITAIGQYNGSGAGLTSIPNSATTATNANTANAIVTRDASGNFSAGTITATLTGNISGNAATVTTNANLTGNVTSVGNATTIAAGVVTNAMLAGSIAITKLASSTISGISLGSNLATLTISSGLDGTSYNGSGAITINIAALGVTNAMLAGSIANAKLSNSTISGIALGSNLATLTIGTYLTGTSYNGSTAVTIATNATSANTASTLVARDASGNFSAGTITAALSGNASTATSATSAGNATTAGGLAVHTGRNNEADKIVRTQANGYILCGYINSSNGNENNNSNADRVWGTNGTDDYLRTYRTSALSVSYAATAGSAPANGGTAAAINQTVAVDTNANLVYSQMGSNDFFRIRVGGASNAGYAEIATADDGTEPIYVRQYTGVFSDVTRTATLLDGSGNTSFPGNISGGYILGSYFNSSAGNSENPTIGQIWTQSTGDNYLRKSTPAHLISQLGLITTGNYTSYTLPLSGGTLTNTSTNTILTLSGTEPHIRIAATGASNGAGVVLAPTTGYDAFVGNFNGGELVLYAASTASVYINSNSIRVNKYRFNGNGSLSGNGTPEIVDKASVGMSMQSLNYHWYSNDAQVRLMELDSSGNTYNLNGTYGTISSDRRLKENIVPATSKLDDIMKLNVVNFNLIGNENKHIGFIAQEIQEIFPSFVHQSDTRKYDEDGNVVSGLEDALGVKIGMEFAILVKAIQELNTKLDAANAEIEALKSK